MISRRVPRQYVSSTIAVRAIEFRDERIQSLVVHSAICCGGARDEPSDELLGRQDSLRRVAVLSGKRKEEPDAM
jgi:hypothetical protein